MAYTCDFYSSIDVVYKVGHTTEMSPPTKLGKPFVRPCHCQEKRGWTLNRHELGDVRLPLMNFSECQNRAGATARPENRKFLDPTEHCCPPARYQKTHCSCIIEGHLPTNPILSALHPQGPKSNIYVHFQ